MRRMINLATTALLKLSPNVMSSGTNKSPSVPSNSLLSGKWEKRFEEEVDGENIAYVEELVFNGSRTGYLEIKYLTRPELNPTPFRFTYISNRDKLTLTFTSEDEKEPMIGNLDFSVKGKELSIRYGNNNTQTYLKKSNSRIWPN